MSHATTPRRVQSKVVKKLSVEELESRTLLAVTVSLLKSFSGGGLAGLTNVDGILFFQVPGLHGGELWKSDGATAGTVLVSDIASIDVANTPRNNNPVNVNGTLYFSASTDASGQELWRSDGTTAGTYMVADLCPGACDTEPNNLTNVNGTLFFTGRDPIDPRNPNTVLYKVALNPVQTFDHAQFLRLYRNKFGEPSTGEADGLERLLSSMEADSELHVATDVRPAAYMLATVKHETGDTFQPVEECFGRCLLRYFDRYEPGTDRGRRLGNTEQGDGFRFRGRGYVQLTGRGNYSRLGAALGLDLVGHPELALDPSISYEILSYGMRHGSFSGKKLGDYITGNATDYFNARRIVNGLDRASRIANYAKKFEAILRGSLLQPVASRKLAQRPLAVIERRSPATSSSAAARVPAVSEEHGDGRPRDGDSSGANTQVSAETQQNRPAIGVSPGKTNSPRESTGAWDTGRSKDTSWADLVDAAILRFRPIAR